jgi:hypothetical protein
MADVASKQQTTALFLSTIVKMHDWGIKVSVGRCSKFPEFNSATKYELTLFAVFCGETGNTQLSVDS